MSKPIYGNYHGYYTKRPWAHDPRLETLPHDLLNGARVLDVGCNEGYVTCEIAQSYKALRVVGVDIDDALVQLAWKRRRAAWSLQSPAERSTATNPTPEQPQPDYFPKSCLHSYGPLSIPPSGTRFPHNVTFKRADWPSESISEDREGYDVVIAFSVIKWIHLNNGDTGVKAFFRRAYDVLSPGGSFVLESQSWDSYQKAWRMDTKLREVGKGLKIMPDDFEGVLTEIGFSKPTRLGVVGEGGFSRPIDLYTKSSIQR